MSEIQDSNHVELSLGAQGRVVIPATMRRALGFHPGDKLVMRVDDGRLVVEKADVIKERLRARFAGLPDNVSLTDELIHERREESRRE